MPGKCAVRFLALAGLLVPLRLALGEVAHAQGRSGRPEGISAQNLAWATDSAEPQRFIAVHGRRALVMGYPETGLEIWAYPLQLISNYQVSFLAQGVTYALDGPGVLRRVEYRPDEVIRTYVGPDFEVRETIFVPLDQPGAIISYDVRGTRDVEIKVRFIPVLNLMWPAALGGQDTGWNDAVHGYVVREPLHGFDAVVASPQTVVHDVIVNRTIQPSKFKTLILRPSPDTSGKRVAQVFAAYDAPGTAPERGLIPQLEAHGGELQESAARHYTEWLGSALQIETQDESVNRALAWAVLALDQAWVCNASLGCGEVAGYGPSRGERRPQYAWFFAGDGLVATEGLLAAGEFERARDELAFIAKYQDKKTGMIWHEISQGVDIDEWRHDYPYMFVHVDITFAYLSTLADYVRVTGDDGFLKENWDGIRAAYGYCESIVDASTGLPRIPVGREGANEQDRMRDDIGLSSSWISAAEGYAELARSMGAQQEAERAKKAADVGRKAIASLDWDAVHHFWLQGHSASGEPMYSERPRPIGLLSQHVFADDQIGQVLDELASPNFETDWGVRNMSMAASEFDPNSYGKGSVSALGSASVARGFWEQHRSVTALQIWDGLLPWNTLDSEGHMHEVLAGDFYHPEIESVPEQTWSSAGLVRATVRGLLGLEIDAARHQLTFAPHLPPEWDEVSMRNVRVGGSVLNLRFTRSEDAVELEAENSGTAVFVSFSPEVPLGAEALEATVTTDDARAGRVRSKVQNRGQDEHVDAAFRAGPGVTRCRIRLRGGVQVFVPRTELVIGQSSKAVRVADVELQGGDLRVRAYVKPDGDSILGLRSGWKLVDAQRAQIESHQGDVYKFQLQVPAGAPPVSKDGYVKVDAVFRFARQ